MKWFKWSGIALLLVPMVVSAQAYPSKPVHVVVAFPPGGSIDVTARIVFDGLTAQLKQQFVLDNRGGAAKLNALTLEPMHMTPDEFAKRLKSDYEKYGKLIKAAAAKVN